MGNSASVTLLNENSQEMNDADLEKVFRAHDADESDSIDNVEAVVCLRRELQIPVKFVTGNTIALDVNEATVPTTSKR